VVGDGALLVDPYSEEEIAQGIARLLDDEDLRARLVERALQRAAGFSWERSVRQIHAGYLKVLGRPLPADAVASAAAMTAVLLVAGCLVFRRMEASFADYV